MFGWLKRTVTKRPLPLLVNWLWFHPQALEKQLNDEACAYFGCCGFGIHKPYTPRHPNGQFAAKKDIPLWKRDAVVFDAYVKELEKKHNCKYKFNK